MVDAMSESTAREIEPVWRARPSLVGADSDRAVAPPRWLGLIVAAGIALGCLLGVASWFRPHPFPVLLPLVFDTGDRGAGSVTAQAPGDAVSLRAGRWFSRTIGAGDPTITAGRLGAALESMAGLRSDETLVVVLCSPARVGIGSTGSGESAEVFVLPGGRAEGLAGWIRLRDVLGALRGVPPSVSCSCSM